jgi:hypothetical protein
MVQQLSACKTKTRREVSKVCIHLYIRENFLYHVFNVVLRDVDCSQLNTLGSICFLIRDYAHTCTEFIETAYREIELSPAAIQSYKQAIGTWNTWPSYTSTSKNRNIAEFRGNALFIIEITNTRLSLTHAYEGG